MTLSNPNTIFGVHSVTLYNIDTRQPYNDGIIKVLGEASISLEGEMTPLNGGSNPYAWKTERGLISSEITLTLREYPDAMFECLLGSAMTNNAAESGGYASTLTNAYGTSVTNATTGIASVSVKTGSEADLKFAGFVVLAASATTVDVYAYTDMDFAQGTDKSFVDNTLKITTAPLTITASTAVTVPGFGVELTGGSGTIAMTEGDTAYFDVRPINTGSKEVTIGKTASVYPDFGLILVAQRPGDKEMTMIDVFKAKGAGLPISMSENSWSEASVTITAQYDATRDGVFSYRTVQSVS